MSLKSQSANATVSFASAPAWGEFADAGQPSGVIVFECEDATYSYPYHTLSRWVYFKGTTDTIRIESGTDKITIYGRKLNHVCAALNGARLHLLRVTGERYSDLTEDVVITEISVATLSGVN